MTHLEWIFVWVISGMIAFVLLEIAAALNNIAGAIRGHYNMILRITDTITKAMVERKTKP